MVLPAYHAPTGAGRPDHRRARRRPPLPVPGPAPGALAPSISAVPATTMPAAVYLGDGEMAVQDLPVPVPGPGEVLVEVPRWDLRDRSASRARPNGETGLGAGTRVVGVVAESHDATSDWPVGPRGVEPDPRLRRVPGLPAGPPVGVPAPRAAGLPLVLGRLLSLPGRRGRATGRHPRGLGTREAALAEPTAIALHTVNVSGVRPEDRVLVTGAGPVGLLILAVLRARGVTDISVSEPAPARRARAAELGAARVLTPEELPQPDLARAVPDPYTFVFECSGRAEAAERGLDQLDAAGTLVFVGTGHEAPRINQNRMIIFELTAVGAYNYDNEGFAPALQLLADGALALDLLIEPEDIGLGDIRATMDRLAAGAIPGKVLVRPEAP